MELDDVHAALQALRKLYRLLQINEDSMQTSRNEILDERARLLLKNLLDGATEKALEIQSKIIAAAKSGVSVAEQLNIAPKLGSNSYGLILRKDELLPAKQTPHDAVSVLSRASKFSNEPGNRKKWCRVCSQSSMKQRSSATTSIDGTHRDKKHRVDADLKEKGSESVKGNENLMQKIIKEIQGNPNPAGNIEKEVEEVTESDFSREVANAITRIESGISNLQLSPDLVKNGGAQAQNTTANSHSPILQRKEGEVKTSQLSNQMTLKGDLNHVKEGSHSSKRVGNSQNVKSIMERIGSMSQNDQNRACQSRHCVHRSSVLQSYDYVPDKPIKMPNQMAQKNTTRRVVKYPSMPLRSRSSVAFGHTKSMPRQVIVRPTLLQTESDSERSSSQMTIHRPKLNRGLPHEQQLESDSEAEAETRMRMRVGARNKDLPHKQEPNSGSEAESESERSVTQTMIRHGPWNKALSRKQESGSSLDLDSYPEESASSSSWTTVQSSMYEYDSAQSEANSLSNSRSSKENNSSSWERNSNYNRDVGRTKPYRSQQHEAGNMVGGLRRLKNKLGLIFYHHHHHHHHNYYDSIDSKRSRSLKDLFHHQNKDKQAVAVHNKLLKMRNNNNKQQVRKFHGLVEGVTRDLRNSRRSRIGGKKTETVHTKKSSIGGKQTETVRKSLTKNKRQAQKLHCRPMLKRYGGIKMAKRVHVGRLGPKTMKSIKMS